MGYVDDFISGAVSLTATPPVHFSPARSEHIGTPTNPPTPAPERHQPSTPSSTRRLNHPTPPGLSSARTQRSLFQSISRKRTSVSGSPQRSSQDSGPSQHQHAIFALGKRRAQDAVEEEVVITPAKRVKLNQAVQSLSTEYNLQEKDKQVLQEVSEASLHEKLVRLTAYVLSLKLELMVSVTERRLHSDDFKKSTGDRLLIVLLSPDLSSYVTSLLNHVMAFIRTHHKTWKIPLEAFDDPDLHSILKSVIGGRLTALRSNIKQQLEKSIKSELDIYTLVHQLKSPHMGVGSEHWHRVAFLRQLFLDHRELVKKGEAKENEFWTYVDQRLGGIRKKIKSLPADQQSAASTTVFGTCLAKDLDMFQYKGSASRQGRSTGLSDLQKSIQRGMVFL